MLRILLLILGLAWTLPAAADASDPVELIRQTSTDLFRLIDENRDSYEADPGLLEKELRDRLLPRLDTIYSARLVLGRHGRGLDREDIESFAEALADLLMDRYAAGLLEFRSRDQIEILPLAGENTERSTRVRTRIQLDSGNRAPVDYVLRKTNDEWRVFDVIIEGISYVATFRNQIGEEIRRDGFDAMLDRLKAGEIDVEVEIEG